MSGMASVRDARRYDFMTSTRTLTILLVVMTAHLPAAQTTQASSGPVSITGCLVDVRDVGGQGGGGAAWQGRVSGYVVTDAQVQPASGAGTPSSSPAATAGRETPGDTPTVFHLGGIATAELLRYRGQQVEVQGIWKPSPAEKSTSERPGTVYDAPGTTSGTAAGQRSSPEVGTGGTASVRAAAQPAIRLGEVQATKIRSLARSCPRAR
jgi:hypothetical protein